MAERGRQIKSARLRHLLSSGRLHGAYKFGRDWVIPESALQKLLGESAKAGRPVTKNNSRTKAKANP